MGKRNTLNNQEVAIIKALIATGDYGNQEIAGLINRARGAAHLDISTGRISNIKKNEIAKYVHIPAATLDELVTFLAPKPVAVVSEYDPLSNDEMRKVLRVKSLSPLVLDITETERVECKKSVTISMKTLAAFANNKGGYMVFGVENKTWLVHGIDAGRFAEFDFNKLNQNILSSLGVGLEIQKKAFQIEGKTIGVIHVATARTKPVIMAQSGDGFAHGHIYFRYPGEDRLITATDLQRLIEDRIRQLSETVLSKHIANILKFGIENSAVMDLGTGMVDGKAGNFLIDPQVLPSISFVKEGEFVEKSGTPTLRLIGDVAPATVVVARPQKLTELYPYSFREFAGRIKKAQPSVKESEITNTVKAHRMKANPAFSAYNFRNKRQEDQFTNQGKLAFQVPSLYNDAAVDFVVRCLSHE
jgi:hypothetical protein